MATQHPKMLLCRAEERQCRMIDGYWLSVKDGDPRAVALYRRHYSCRAPQGEVDYIRYGFSGQGESMVLLTLMCDALFVWQHSLMARSDNQCGVNCAVFRNESPILSSALIREACQLAWQRWPEQRLFTYVDPSRVRPKRDPGRCFVKAGWHRTGERSKRRGLVILELLPR